MAWQPLSGKGIFRTWLLFSSLLFFGRLSHAQFSRHTSIDNVAPGSIELTSAEEALGMWCARAGDVDGDGLDDILVSGPSQEGLRALLIYGQRIPPGKVDPFNAQIRKSILTGGVGEM